MFVDPFDHDPFVLQARADEEAREQRRDRFMAYVQQARVPTLLRHVIDLIEDRPDWHYERIGVYTELQAYAEAEGWSAVIIAIGQALRSAEQDAQEVEKRR